MDDDGIADAPEAEEGENKTDKGAKTKAVTDDPSGSSSSDKKKNKGKKAGEVIDANEEDGDLM